MGWKVSHSATSSSGRRTVACRVILGLTLLLLLVMPITERFATWDDFGHGGGEDVELTLLSGLAICGLVALLADQAIGDPGLADLLGHRLRRPRIRLMRVAWVLDVCAFPRVPPAERCADRSLPLSLLFLRI